MLYPQNGDSVVTIDSVTSLHPMYIELTVYKKLRYRRGTMRRAVSVETVRNVAQVFVELHLISPATGE